MIREIVIPDVGPIKEEPKIIRWLKGEGDPVKRGEILLEVETTKATLEIESTHEGFVRRIYFDEGESVSPLTTIALIGEKDDPIPDIDPRRHKDQSRKAPPISRPTATGAPKGGARARASPLAKRLAREMGVDLAGISGTGPGGRITREDVLGAADSGGTPETGGLVSLSPTRMRIAATVSRSFSTIPHIYVSQEIDMGRAREMKEASGGKISYDALFLRAVAISLKEFPSFNATMEENRVRISEESNVGFIVETDDGIIVPVVRDAVTKSLERITEEIKYLALKAREKRLPAEAMSGSSFTISNLGKYGVHSFSAIV
ncbi:MAG: 2-oxo acid dehydrogenase subunit E2, partial [Theionarchaea archaeon]|nr:2-oxo acid dehydrogenase subunit E2 [Theionarchaea archaeon]